MSKTKVRDIAASVRQHLLNKARQTNRPFSELAQYFAMERFLYRLSKSSYADKFILKGALMLPVWKAPLARPTMDIDMLGQIDNNIEVIVDVIRSICNQYVEPDGITFDADGVGGERITEDADYEGVRIKFRGTLGTVRISMQVVSDLVMWLSLLLHPSLTQQFLIFPSPIFLDTAWKALLPRSLKPWSNWVY